MAEPTHAEPPRTEQPKKFDRLKNWAKIRAQKIHAAGSNASAIEAARTMTRVQALIDRIPTGLTAEQTIERVLRNNDEDAALLLRQLIRTNRLTSKALVEYASTVENRISTTLLNNINENVQADILSRLRGLEAVTTDALDAFAKSHPTAAARGDAFRTALTEAAPDISLLKRFEQISATVLEEIAGEAAAGKTGAGWFKKAATGTPITWLYNAGKNHPGVVATLVLAGGLYFGWEPTGAFGTRWLDTKWGITDTGKARGEVQEEITKTAFSQKAKEFFEKNPFVYRGIIKMHTAEELNDPAQVALIETQVATQPAIRQKYAEVGTGTKEKALGAKEAEFSIETIRTMFQMERDAKKYPAVSEFKKRLEKDTDAKTILDNFAGIKFLFYNRAQSYYERFGANSDALEKAMTRVFAEIELLKDPRLKPQLPSINQKNLTLPPEAVRKLEEMLGADITKAALLLQNPKVQTLFEELERRQIALTKYATLEDYVAGKAASLPDGYEVEPVATAVQKAINTFDDDQLTNANIEMALYPKEPHVVRNALDEAFSSVMPTEKPGPVPVVVDKQQMVVEALKRNFTTKKTEAQIKTDAKAIVEGRLFNNEFSTPGSMTPEALDTYLTTKTVKFLTDKKKGGYTLK